MNTKNVMNKYMDRWSQLAPYILLTIVLSIVAYTRIRLLSVPLERDEGEFAYMGQLILKGSPPYLHAYTMKLPGVAAFYALFMMLFGQTSTAIHLGLLIVNGVTIFFVYLLTRKFFDRETAILSCAIYAVLSLSQLVFGLHAHATHFVVVFVLAGLILLFRYLENSKYCFVLFSGLSFGLAFIMKQHAVFFILFAALYLVWHSYKTGSTGYKAVAKGMLLFLTGVGLPYVLIITSLTYAGSFDDFWFWTVTYAREYASLPSFEQGWVNFTYTFPSIVKPFLPVWWLAVAGFISMCICRRKTFCVAFMGGLSLSSILSICPGLVFRDHYFVLLLPAVSILAGFAVTNMVSLISKPRMVGVHRQSVIFLISLLLIAYGVKHEKKYLFTESPLEVSRSTYDYNPFPEAVTIAEYIKKNTTENDRIAILGSEPEILFYADRLSATGHIYMYGLMEEHPYAGQMQLQAIQQITTSQPKIIVFVAIRASWLYRATSIRTIFRWSQEYLEQNYDLVGIADLLALKTEYVWNGDAAGYEPKSNFFIRVYRRK